MFVSNGTTISNFSEQLLQLGHSRLELCDFFAKLVFVVTLLSDATNGAGLEVETVESLSAGKASTRKLHEGGMFRLWQPSNHQEWTANPSGPGSALPLWSPPLDTVWQLANSLPHKLLELDSRNDFGACLLL